ncbi:unnamed protein product [marine sediment metagenome]|uniref:Uncharacterized protein n=1 Tax=marine sediment metagenome TaxID=412755 RepID=X1AQJ2_9ZZZZ
MKDILKTKPKHFTDLLVWQKSHKLFVNVYKEFENFPHKVGISIIVVFILGGAARSVASM